MRSQTNAALFGPRRSTFSGIRSELPDPAYCTNRPAVTRINTLSTTSGESEYELVITDKRFNRPGFPPGVSVVDGSEEMETSVVCPFALRTDWARSNASVGAFVP
jgi:hypothetical protein